MLFLLCHAMRFLNQKELMGYKGHKAPQHLRGKQSHGVVLSTTKEFLPHRLTTILCGCIAYSDAEVCLPEKL